jgi:uncharacterized ubiquitin-like protein YukD
MTEAVENTNSENVMNDQQTAQQPTADLNVSDLSAIKSIIDVATQRGAFRAPELESVGKIYNKLTNFLESITKKD